MTHIVNTSFGEVSMPNRKDTIITPRVKKSNLDPNEMANYRPISNISFTSKIIERVVATRVKTHLLKFDL